MKIASIEAIPIRIARPRTAAVGSAGSPTGLREGHKRYRWSTTVPAIYSTDFETALVRITTDSSLIGWGEAQAPLAPEVACEIVRLLLCPVVEDLDFDGSVERIAEIWDLMYQSMRVRGQTGGFMLDAISGVDIALWDLAGKIQNRSVAALIASDTPKTVPAYYSGVPGSSIEERIANADKAKQQGFRTFKLFYDAPTTAEMLELIDALKIDAFAVDALWRLTLTDAIAFGKELDKRNALWLEAPLPPEEAAAHTTLAHAIKTPIAIGESYRTRYELAPFLDAASILQPDLGRCGITEFLRIASRTNARIIPHVSIAMGPQIAAAIHVAAACGCEMLEHNPNVFTVANQYLNEQLIVKDAAYHVPQGPGLGIVVQI